MNNLKYDEGVASPPSVLSEVETQVENLLKDVENLYLQTVELEERLRSGLAPAYPEEVSSKAIMCSISPLGDKLESIHNLLLCRISHLKDLNSRIKL